MATEMACRRPHFQLLEVRWHEWIAETLLEYMGTSPGEALIRWVMDNGFINQPSTHRHAFCTERNGGAFRHQLQFRGTLQQAVCSARLK